MLRQGDVPHRIAGNRDDVRVFAFG